MTKPRHHIGGGGTENLHIGQNEGDNGFIGLDGFDPVRGHDAPHDLAAFRIG